MVNEESIRDQIKAIEGWATAAYEEAKRANPNLSEILENLKSINLQGRKLEWRGGNLKSLPDSKESNQLKKNITEIRVAAMTAYGDIKKEKQISRGSGRYLKVVASKAIDSLKLMDRLHEEDPNLEDFSNPHTLEQIKRLMEEHGIRHVNFTVFNGEVSGSGAFGKHGANIFVKSNFEIIFARPQAEPAFNNCHTVTNLSYSKRYPGKYPGFKAFLTKVLEIISRGIKGECQDACKEFRRNEIDV